MRDKAEPIQMERWDKWGEAEFNYMHKYAHQERAVVEALNRRFAIGEVVLDRVTKCAGIVVRLFERTGVYVIFPQYDVPQLVCAINVEKLNED